MSQACARTEALLTVEGIVDSSSFTIQHGRVIDPNIASRPKLKSRSRLRDGTTRARPAHILPRFGRFVDISFMSDVLFYNFSYI
jgi:hypothetical protein